MLVLVKFAWYRVSLMILSLLCFVIPISSSAALFFATFCLHYTNSFYLRLSLNEKLTELPKAGVPEK